MIAFGWIHWPLYKLPHRQPQKMAIVRENLLLVECARRKSNLHFCAMEMCATVKKRFSACTILWNFEKLYYNKHQLSMPSCSMQSFVEYPLLGECWQQQSKVISVMSSHWSHTHAESQQSLLIFHRRFSYALSLPSACGQTIEWTTFICLNR